MFFIILIVILLAFTIWSSWYGAIYVPTLPTIVSKMIAISQVKKGERAVDIGSGDGRIVIELAKRGVDAYGIEINPVLVVWSLFKIKMLGLKNAHIIWGDFWKMDLSSYDVIYIFVASYVMKKMDKKLKNNSKKGARIICESFQIPNWTPVKKEGSVFVYKI